MKPHKTIFENRKLEQEFNNLSAKDPIKKGLIKAIRDIKEDFSVGRLITRNTHNKQKIKEIISKYRTRDIRIYNLPSAWRMIYTITSSEDIKIVAVILEWMNHKDYEKMLK